MLKIQVCEDPVVWATSTDLLNWEFNYGVDTHQFRMPNSLAAMGVAKNEYNRVKKVYDALGSCLDGWDPFPDSQWANGTAAFIRYEPDQNCYRLRVHGQDVHKDFSTAVEARAEFKKYQILYVQVPGKKVALHGSLAAPILMTHFGSCAANMTSINAMRMIYDLSKEELQDLCRAMYLDPNELGNTSLQYVFDHFADPNARQFYGHPFTVQSQGGKLCFWTEFKGVRFPSHWGLPGLIDYLKECQEFRKGVWTWTKDDKTNAFTMTQGPYKATIKLNSYQDTIIGEIDSDVGLILRVAGALGDVLEKVNRRLAGEWDPAESTFKAQGRGMVFTANRRGWQVYEQFGPTVADGQDVTWVNAGAVHQLFAKLLSEKASLDRPLTLNELTRIRYTPRGWEVNDKVYPTFYAAQRAVLAMSDGKEVKETVDATKEASVIAGYEIAQAVAAPVDAPEEPILFWPGPDLSVTGTRKDPKLVSIYGTTSLLLPIGEAIAALFPEADLAAIRSHTGMPETTKNLGEMIAISEFFANTVADDDKSRFGLVGGVFEASAPLLNLSTVVSSVRDIRILTERYIETERALREGGWVRDPDSEDHHQTKTKNGLRADIWIAKNGNGTTWIQVHDEETNERIFDNQTHPAFDSGDIVPAYTGVEILENILDGRIDPGATVLIRHEGLLVKMRADVERPGQLDDLQASVTVMDTAFLGGRAIVYEGRFIATIERARSLAKELAELRRSLAQKVAVAFGNRTVPLVDRYTLIAEYMDLGSQE